MPDKLEVFATVEDAINATRAFTWMPDGSIARMDREAQWANICLATIRADKARIAELNGALTKINDIRNSIIGYQGINWSAHIYPLVAALNEVGYVCPSYEEVRGVARTQVQWIAELRAEIASLKDALARAPCELGSSVISDETCESSITSRADWCPYCLVRKELQDQERAEEIAERWGDNERMEESG